MPRGKTTKCPICESSMSACYVKIPRSGKVEYAGKTRSTYYCRNCETVVVEGAGSPRRV